MNGGIEVSIVSLAAVPGTPDAAFVLAHVVGLGLSSCWRLAEEAGSLTRILERGMLPKQVSWFGKEFTGWGKTVQQEVGRLRNDYLQRGWKCLLFGASDYPSRLYDLPDPPLCLFAEGNLSLLDRPAIALVGTRRPDDYGRWLVDSLSTSVAQTGWLGLSGLAWGIDGRAHQRLIDAGGVTAAILGTGLDSVYPRDHQRLQWDIRERGLLLTEYLPGTPVRGFQFLRRNRLLAALSQVVLVIQAGKRSGALNTASHALALGREVWSVPADVRRTPSQGCNQLIADGARPVLNGEDLQASLMAEVSSWAREGRGLLHEEPFEPEPSGFYGFDEQVFLQLNNEPRTADDVAASMNAPVETVLAALVRLELDGKIVLAGGGRYRRRHL